MAPLSSSVLTNSARSYIVHEEEDVFSPSDKKIIETLHDSLDDINDSIRSSLCSVGSLYETDISESERSDSNIDLRRDYDTAMWCLANCESLISTLQQRLVIKDEKLALNAEHIANLEETIDDMALQLANLKASKDEHHGQQQRGSINSTMSSLDDEDDDDEDTPTDDNDKTEEYSNQCQKLERRMSMPETNTNKLPTAIEVKNTRTRRKSLLDKPRRRLSRSLPNWIGDNLQRDRYDSAVERSTSISKKFGILRKKSKNQNRQLDYYFDESLRSSLDESGRGEIDADGDATGWDNGHPSFSPIKD